MPHADLALLRAGAGLLLVAMWIAMPVAAAEGDQLTPEQRAWLDGHGPIRYAPDPAYAPFEFASAGGAEGINVDLLNRMSRNLGFAYEVVLYDNWTAVLDAMRAGDVDLMGSLAITDGRDAYMDFSEPYMRVGEVFYVRTGSAATSPEDLHGKVAVVKDYAAAQWLAEHRPDLERVEVDDMRSGMAALSAGDVDAFFQNIPVGAYALRQDGFTNIQILGPPLYYSDARWGVPQGQGVLLSIVENGMGSIPAGEQSAIFEYWSGHDLGVQQDDRSGPTWLRPFAWGLVFLVAVSAVWIGSLRSTVRRRTGDLEALNSRLEQRVAERTAELEEANRHLDAFASSVSHDLKQPLSVIGMQSRIVRMQAQKGVAVDLENLDRQVHRMQQFIQGLLDFSRASRPAQREEVDVASMAHDVRSTLEPDAGPRDLVVQKGLTAHADPVLLRIVMMNLLGNSWKFTAGRPGPRIEVGGDGTRFYVRDNGPGFDAKAMGDRLFQPFERGDGAAGVEGTGIGLATVARIVRAHGGQVWCESRPGFGATFWWTLPRGG